MADALVAAKAIAAERYPDALAAILAGSVVRDNATKTSDLDLVIVLDGAGPYRESFKAHGWPVEAFVHTADSYPEYFARDVQRRRPSLPRMCAEGAILVDKGGLATRMKEEGAALLAAGPAPLTDEELAKYRYVITDLLTDLKGSVRYEETIFIANELVQATIDLLLLHHSKWLGKGKWVPRALGELDVTWMQQVSFSMKLLYQSGQKDFLVTLVTKVLGLVGGELFEGYSEGKR